MPKVDLNSVPRSHGSGYPEPFHEPCKDRFTERLSQATLLTQFGVNLVTLRPGAWSSQRHWHEKEDEFVYVLSGEVTLLTDSGEEVLRAGDAAGFKSNNGDGHCLQNRSKADALVLEVGSRMAGEQVWYSDIDMKTNVGGKPTHYAHRDGRPYADAGRKGP